MIKKYIFVEKYAVISFFFIIFAAKTCIHENLTQTGNCHPYRNNETEQKLGMPSSRKTHENDV